MVIHQLLSSKAEKIMGELEHFSVKLTDLLSSKKGASQAPPQDESKAA
jgi:hypothetical protein